MNALVEHRSDTAFYLVIFLKLMTWSNNFFFLFLNKNRSCIVFALFVFVRSSSEQTISKVAQVKLEKSSRRLE